MVSGNRCVTYRPLCHVQKWQQNLLCTVRHLQQSFSLLNAPSQSYLMHQTRNRGPSPIHVAGQTFAGHALVIWISLVVILTACSGSPYIGEAEQALEVNDYEQALTHIEHALAEDPADAEAHLLNLHIRTLQARDAETPDARREAYQQVRRAAQQAENSGAEFDNELLTHTDEVYTSLMNDGAARVEAATEPADFKEAASYFGSARFVRPDSSGAYQREAEALLDGNHHEEAIPVLEQAIDTLSDPVDARLYALLGSLYLQFDRNDEATELIEAAIAQYPDHDDLQQLRLNALKASGDMEQALDAYAEQAERNPDNPDFWYNYGTLLMNDGQYESAVGPLRQAAERAPEDAGVYLNLGIAYWNRAVAIDTEVLQKQEAFRANDEEPTAREEEELANLTERRQRLVERAVGPFEEAFDRLHENDGMYPVACRELYRAYVLLERTEDAAAIDHCFDHIDQDLDGAMPNSAPPEQL